MTALKCAGRVGVPGPTERKCPRCKGHGQTAAETHMMDGCDWCAATGVVPLPRARTALQREQQP